MNEIVFWRLDKVLSETGLKRTHLYQMASKGDSPKQIKLGKRACAWPHESPHFCATLKSPSLGFPRAAGWRIIREGELCARRRNDLISFMTS